MLGRNLRCDTLLTTSRVWKKYSKPPRFGSRAIGYLKFFLSYLARRRSWSASELMPAEDELSRGILMGGLFMDIVTVYLHKGSTRLRVMQ
jgi:hypothetical protein